MVGAGAEAGASPRQTTRLSSSELEGFVPAEMPLGLMSLKFYIQLGN